MRFGDTKDSDVRPIESLRITAADSREDRGWRCPPYSMEAESVACRLFVSCDKCDRLVRDMANRVGDARAHAEAQLRRPKQSWSPDERYRDDDILGCRVDSSHHPVRHRGLFH